MMKHLKLVGPIKERKAKIEHPEVEIYVENCLIVSELVDAIVKTSKKENGYEKVNFDILRNLWNLGINRDD